MSEPARTPVEALDPLERLWPRRLGALELGALLGPEADGLLAGVVERTVWNPVWELMDRGGKRWRPLISRSAYLASGGVEPEPTAAFQVVEVLHTGSLIVDDIQDEATERRNGPAIHISHGVATALNAANAAYFRALSGLRGVLEDRLRLRALDMLSEELFVAHLGQALDLSLGRALKAGKAVAPAHYRAMARAKTGALVRMAARIGAIAADAPAPVEDALACWAEHVGLAYQIKDDLEDLQEGLSDVAACRVTLPLLLLLEQASPASREFVLGCLGNSELNALERRSLRGMMESAQVAGRVTTEAHQVRDAALQALAVLPPGESRAFLENLTQQLSGV